MPHACTEDWFVERPAIALFAQLGGSMVSALAEVFTAPSSLNLQTA